MKKFYADVIEIKIGAEPDYQWVVLATEAKQREDALREELADTQELAGLNATLSLALQQRLTIAESLLGDWYAANASGEIMVDDCAYKIVTATAEILHKPAAEGKGK